MPTMPKEYYLKYYENHKAKMISQMLQKKYCTLWNKNVTKLNARHSNQKCHRKREKVFFETNMKDVNETTCKIDSFRQTRQLQSKNVDFMNQNIEHNYTVWCLTNNEQYRKYLDGETIII